MWSGDSIFELADRIAECLTSGMSVALGFECPLFVPHRSEPAELTRSRSGEGHRSWSAGAGLGSLVTGFTQATWLLERLRRFVRSEPELCFSWPAFTQADVGLLIWEAFISGPRKRTSHEDDAIEGVEAFLDSLPEPHESNFIHEESVTSLIAASALRAGWKAGADLIDQPCIVIAGRDWRITE